jgi:tyrosinase
MSHVVITGAQGGSTAGAVAPNRLEINDFVKPENSDQFSLFIQALSKSSFVLHLSTSLSIDCRTSDVLYGTDQQESLSHFGLGGIHGIPYQAWEGAGGNEPVEGREFGGYCTHGSVVFPTWHRPYVSLYEASIISIRSYAAKY